MHSQSPAGPAPLTPAERAAAAATLAGLRDDLRRRTARVPAHLQNADRELPDDAPDRAQVQAQDDVLDALNDQGTAELAAVEAALQRLEAGTYGACARCGEPIGAPRLRARPAATTCVACA